MPVQKLGMVFTYTKPKIVPATPASAPATPALASATPALALASATSTRSSSTIGMVQTVKRNTSSSIVSIIRIANQKCSSCGS